MSLTTPKPREKERKRETEREASHELLGERLNTNSNVLKRCSLSALSCSTCPFSSHSSPFFFTSRQFCDLYQPVKISKFLKTKSMCGSYRACVCLTTYHFWERKFAKISDTNFLSNNRIVRGLLYILGFSSDSLRWTGKAKIVLVM